MRPVGKAEIPACQPRPSRYIPPPRLDATPSRHAPFPEPSWRRPARPGPAPAAMAGNRGDGIAGLQPAHLKIVSPVFRMCLGACGLRDGRVFEGAHIAFGGRLRVKFCVRLAHAAGEVAEWLKAHAWNACIRETVSRVRIPLSPPVSPNALKSLFDAQNQELTESLATHACYTRRRNGKGQQAVQAGGKMDVSRSGSGRQPRQNWEEGNLEVARRRSPR